MQQQFFKFPFGSATPYGRRAGRHRLTIPVLRTTSSAALICGLLALAHTFSSANQDQTKSLPALAAGEHQLRGGETHSYRVNLKAGEFCYALVEQKGIDVAVTLFGPDGQKIAETDSPNDRWNTEPVLVVADKAGEYRVDVSSPNTKAEPGRYEIKIIAQRDATQADKGHFTAQRLFEEAETLHSQPTATAKRSAIEKHQRALPLFRAAGDIYREALTLRLIGLAHLQLSEFRPALGCFDQALPLARQLGDRRLEGTVENFLGGTNDVLANPRTALDHYARALSIAREIGDQSTEGSALNNIGKIHNDMADRQKALDYYLQALPIFRKLGNKRTEGITLNNIGVAYNLVGEPQKAIDYLQQAVPLLQAVGDKNAESYTLSNIGGAYARSGEHPKALNYYARAQVIQKETGNRAQQAETLDLIGVAYLAQGQPEKALDYHQQALQIQRAIGNPRREAISLNNLGYVYNLLGKPDKALEQFEPALSTFRSLGDLDSLAIALEGSARAEQARGNLDEAQKRVEESLTLIETIRARSTSQQLRASYLASMKRAYEFYIDFLMQQHARNPTRAYDAAALRASERGRARSMTEMLNEAHVDLRHGVDAALIEREVNLRQRLNAKAQRQIQLLAQRANKEELATVKREVSALEDEFEQVQAAIRKSSPGYAALTQPQPLSLEEIQQQLDPNSLLLEYSLGEERSYLWAVTSSSVNSYELPRRQQIQNAARKVYELLTTRSAIKPGETVAQKQNRLAQADAQLHAAARELSAIVLGPIASQLGSKRLVVIADDALLYVPFAALSVVSGPSSVAKVSTSVPQQTTDHGPRTTDNYRPLILDHEIVALPSASALAVQRKNLAGRKPAARAVAVIADPVFSNADDRLKGSAKSEVRKEAQGDAFTSTRILEHLADDSTGKLAIKRLRFTRQEADQILAVAPRSSNLRALDFQASRATATGADLSHYRYVHFATHGYLDSDRQDLSAVVLSLVDEQGKPQDGFLRAHEIYNLNLPAELVVLSACQTGLGKESKGEGLVGLTRGFMYAGARRVVVSLWSVNDKATADLMQRFYRGMLRENLTPAAALRKAQAEMARHPQWQSPYYWAAFVLQGEWK